MLKTDKYKILIMPVTRSARGLCKPNDAPAAAKTAPQLVRTTRNRKERKESVRTKSTETHSSPEVKEVPKKGFTSSQTVVKAKYIESESSFEAVTTSRLPRAAKTKSIETVSSPHLQSVATSRCAQGATKDTPKKTEVKSNNSKPFVSSCLMKNVKVKDSETKIKSQENIKSVQQRVQKILSSPQALDFDFNTPEKPTKTDQKASFKTPRGAPIITPIAPAINRSMNTWTPTVNKRKAATKDTFPGRLDWKMRQYGMPVTSTPKPNESLVSKKDIQTCFGFDDSEEENEYSALISPIAFTRKNRNLDNKAMKKNQPKSDDNQAVLQENNSDEKISIPSLTNAKRSKENKALESKVADKKPAKKAKYPTSKKFKLNKNANAEIENGRTGSPHLYEFDDVMSSQKLEADVSGVTPLDCDSFSDSEQIFVKRSEDGDLHEAGFNALLARYGKVEDDDSELHFNVGHFRRTYNCSKKREDAGFAPIFPRKLKRKRATNKRTSHRNAHIHDEEDDDSDEMDAETKHWLDQKNKEFDDVLHVPLMVTKSISNKDKC